MAAQRQGADGVIWRPRLGIGRVLLHERRVRGVARGALIGARAAFHGIRAVTRGDLVGAAGASACELWEVPRGQRGRYVRRFVLEGAGLCVVASLSVWGAAAAFHAGGAGVLNGAAALLFAAVVLLRALAVWWRADCLRADRVVGFLSWLRDGGRVEGGR